MRVRSVPVEPATLALLPGTQMSDAYRLIVAEVSLDARTAAARMFSRAPAWVGALMALRNRLVAPLGLKTRVSDQPTARRRIGFFPVIAEASGCVLLGLDDKHLDFRIAVDVVPVGADQQQITTTTMVRTHNLLGRAYLATVLPFHRLIVPAMLAQAASHYVADVPGSP